jgi:parallel beta-helix repeat protein
MRDFISEVAVLVLLVFLVGCGGSNSSNQVNQPAPQSVAVTVSSPSAGVLLGNATQLTASVTGTSNTAVTWSVNGISRGDSTVGTISSTGLYTAPQALPNPAGVTIRATSQADSTASGNALLNITSDVTVNVATNPSGMSSVAPGETVQLVATIVSAGHPNTAVNWAVNGVANGNSTVGTVTMTGTGTALYTAPAVAPTPNSVSISATCLADPSKSAQMSATIQPCTLNGTIGYVAPSPYTPPSGATCDVSDVSTLASCIAAVHNGTTANVRFMAMVNCSGTNTCLVDLTNVNGPVTLFGAPGVTAGFLRTDTYSYPILQVSSANNVTVANLTFDEGPDDPACTPFEVNGSYTYPCRSTITIDHSSHIALEQVNILHSKNHGIEFSATQNLTIQDSQIQDVGVFGIWSGFNQSLVSSNVTIANNLIQDVKSNGIFLSYTQNTTIRSNTLKHNHHVALFNVCGGPCPGGQIDMLDNSSLQIYSNEIRDGHIDLNNATGQTDGIEISEQNQDVLITNNEITNNLGGGILANPGVVGSNFVITGNKIYNNGVNLYQVPGAGIQEFGDCFSP